MYRHPDTRTDISTYREHRPRRPMLSKCHLTLYNFELKPIPAVKVRQNIKFAVFCRVFLILKADVICSPLNRSEFFFQGQLHMNKIKNITSSFQGIFFQQVPQTSSFHKIATKDHCMASSLLNFTQSKLNKNKHLYVCLTETVPQKELLTFGYYPNEGGGWSHPPNPKVLGQFVLGPLFTLHGVESQPQISLKWMVLLFPGAGAEAKS